MKNYVISLATATERRRHIIQEFGQQGIDFEFFDAVTPTDTPSIGEQLGIDLQNNQRLSVGEKACFLSHVSLWQKMLDDDIEYMAIFEDDVYLGEKADKFLHDDTWLSDITFDIIKLETFFEKVALGKSIATSLDRKLRSLNSPHMGAGGYLISTTGASKLMGYLTTLSADKFVPIDHIIFEILKKPLNIYQVVPALCVQSMFFDKNQLPSSLEVYRQNNPKQNQVKLENAPVIDFAKIIRKLKRSIGKRTFFQQVVFR
ncbi:MULTISPECIES: glycosyltransferase family 25 protein [unclassified Acinetobacter]|uniref:glycosyltransferase family 25 protein n=1 Tax=unclassified Acinetobacter TaxID=196816 RepID=UPI0035BA08F9